MGDFRGIHVHLLKLTEANGRRYYVATGNWSLIEKELGPQDEAAPLPVRMVAGACNVPNALLIPFQRELVHAAA